MRVPMVWRRVGRLRRWKRQPQIVININGSSEDFARQLAKTMAQINHLR